jgi:tripartite-type tricarboxylate transporter receptor subunit TctC
MPHAEGRPQQHRHAGIRLATTTFAAFVATAAICTSAQAQAFPARTVRITTPYSTGIGPDIASRLVAEKLSRIWNQSVIVESRPGASGAIAFNAVKKAAPDGHELVAIGNAHLAINPVLIKDWNFDLLADFAPANLLYNAYWVIVVAANSPHRSVRDLIDAAKAAPERVSYATPYVGSPNHLGAAQLGFLAGAQMLPVHFKDTGPLVASVANGDTTFAILTTGSSGAMVKAGRMRILAAVDSKRLPTHPDVPTVSESGGPANFSVPTWVTIAAPRATPANVVGRIGADIARALAEPDVIAKFRSFGLEPATASPAQIAEMTRAELAINADLVKKAGIKAE